MMSVALTIGASHLPDWKQMSSETKKIGPIIYQNYKIEWLDSQSALKIWKLSSLIFKRVCSSVGQRFQKFQLSKVNKTFRDSVAARSGNERKVQFRQTKFSPFKTFQTCRTNDWILKFLILKSSETNVLISTRRPISIPMQLWRIEDRGILTIMKSTRFNASFRILCFLQWIFHWDVVFLENRLYNKAIARCLATNAIHCWESETTNVFLQLGWSNAHTIHRAALIGRRRSKNGRICESCLSLNR